MAYSRWIGSSWYIYPTETDGADELVLHHKAVEHPVRLSVREVRSCLTGRYNVVPRLHGDPEFREVLGCMLTWLDDVRERAAPRLSVDEEE